MSEDEIILTHILQCRSIDLVINKPVLTPIQHKQFEEYKLRRQAKEPLQYILGTCNFMGLELKVDPAVLIPRPETEQLVDAAIKELKQKQKGTVPKTGTGPFILDLGTGSGNIAIALAKFVPQSSIVSVDVSAAALKVARANAHDHGLEDRITFVQGDILNKQYLYSPPFFDMIISNPPYIPTNQLKSLPCDVQHEPCGALDGGEDGLNFFRNIIKYTPCLLRKPACLMMEFGDGQAEPVKKLIEAQGGFSAIEIIKDLAGRERIINGKVYH